MKLEMNRAWNDALRLLTATREVVLVIAGVFFFLPYFAFMLIAPDPLAGLGPEQVRDSGQVMSRLSAYYAGFWWVMLLMVLAQAVGMLGLLALLTDRRRPTVAEALKIGAAKVLPYIAAYLLVGIALGVAMVILSALAAVTGAEWLVGLVLLVVIVAWIVLFLRFSLVGPILVKEAVANPVAALRRSWTLTSGNAWRLFAFFFLLLTAMLVVTMVLSGVLGLTFGLLGEEAARFGDALVVSLANATWATLFLAVLAAVHSQLAGPAPAALSETFE